MKNYIWHKQTVSSHLEIITCPKFDPIKNFHRDPTGVYVLIRIDMPKSIIEVAICNKNHVIIKVFRGKKAEQIYYTIFQYEKTHRFKWFSRNDHAAYLGKELKKAEHALLNKEDYIQE